MKIWLDCNPSKTTNQGKRANFKTGTFFADEKELSWTQFLTVLLKSHSPNEPMEGPLSIDIVYVWPLTKADEKTKAQKSALDEIPFIFHDQKPDWDNAPKSLVDVLAKLKFFVDDKQIVFANVTKLRGRKAGILIDINQIQKQPGKFASMAILEAMSGE